MVGSLRPDSYRFSMFPAYFFVLLVSVLCILAEMWEFQTDEPVFMLVGGVVIVLILAGASLVTYSSCGARKGKFSFDAYRRLWLDQLTKCRAQV